MGSFKKIFKILFLSLFSFNAFAGDATFINTSTSTSFTSTVNVNDDNPFGVGTGSPYVFLWETADANANAALFAAPEGGSVDVPVHIFGDASAINVDLGLFNGITDPTVAILSDAHTKALMLSHNGTDAVVSTTSGDVKTSISGGDFFFSELGTATVGNTTFNSTTLKSRASAWDTDGSADTWDYYWQVEPTSASTTTALYKLYASKNAAAGTALVSFTTTSGNPVFTGNVAATGGSYGTSQGSGSTTLYGTFDDGASAIGVILKNSDTLSNATSLIAQFQNNTTAYLNVGFAGALTWPTAGQAVAAASYWIGRDADATNQLHFNVPTGATYEFSINDTAEVLLSSTSMSFKTVAAGYYNLVNGTDGAGLQFRPHVTTQTSSAGISFTNDPFTANQSFSASSGTQVFVQSAFTLNQTGTAGFTANKITVTETATGSGTKLFADWGTAAGGTQFSVTNTGLVTALGGIKTKLSGANVTAVAPTDAELDAAFGDPTAVGSGFVGVLDDNNDGVADFIVFTTGNAGEWFWIAGTKAL